MELAHPAIAAGAAERMERLSTLLGGPGLEFGDRVRVALAFGGIQAAISRHAAADPVALRAALLDAAAMLLRPRRRTGAAAS